MISVEIEEILWGERGSKRYRKEKGSVSLVPYAEGGNQLSLDGSDEIIFLWGRIFSFLKFSTYHFLSLGKKVGFVKLNQGNVKGIYRVPRPGSGPGQYSYKILTRVPPVHTSWSWGKCCLSQVVPAGEPNPGRDVRSLLPKPPSHNNPPHSH